MAEATARPATVCETHISFVFFLGDRAYKLKKPVDLGFIDLRTRQQRLTDCVREVELNRRLAPDVYLGVADVHGPDGRPCDHLVVMRRLPEERRLSALLQADGTGDDLLRQVARRVAAFHAAAARGPQIAAEGSRDALRGRWVANFDQVRPFHGTVLDAADAEETQRRALGFLAGRQPLFASRAGRVVDGHGDLLADDIFCLDDGPRIIDCLEFDDRLRWLDALDDASFLAMDVERLGMPGLAQRFLDWYAEFAGDPAPASLRHHYVAYRAFVRAKVACLRSVQGDAHAGEEARRLATLALRHLRAGAVSLVLVGGLPGTGKSTLAGALADHLGFALLSSDRVRKELAGIAPGRSAAAPYGAGIYTEEHTAATYAELLDRAQALLTFGESVVLDASWNKREHRNAAAALARRVHADLVAVRCDAPPALAAARLRDRPRGASDADAAVAAAMRAVADPWPEATAVDTTGPFERARDTALRVVRPAGAADVWRPRRPELPPG